MIEYQDLLGRPWAEMDCTAAARTALGRLGFEVSAVDLPSREDDLGPVLARIEGDEPSPWEFLGRDAARATDLGDVVLTSSELGHHVWVLVGQFQLLSSSVLRGVHLAPLRAAQGVVGVYRWKGARR